MRYYPGSNDKVCAAGHVFFVYFRVFIGIDDGQKRTPARQYPAAGAVPVESSR